MSLQESQAVFGRANAAARSHHNQGAATHQAQPPINTSQSWAANQGPPNANPFLMTNAAAQLAGRSPFAGASQGVRPSARSSQGNVTWPPLNVSSHPSQHPAQHQSSLSAANSHPALAHQPDLQPHSQVEDQEGGQGADFGMRNEPMQEEGRDSPGRNAAHSRESNVIGNQEDIEEMEAALEEEFEEERAELERQAQLAQA